MNIKFLIPLVFYAAHQLIMNPSRKYLIVYALGLVYQFYCVIYTGFFLFYFSIFYMIILSFVYKKNKFILFYFTKKEYIYTLLITCISLSLMFLLLAPYVYSAEDLGYRNYSFVTNFLPRPLSFFLSHNSSVPWRILSSFGDKIVSEWWLHILFPGILPYLGLIIALVYIIKNLFIKKPINKTILSLVAIILLILILYIRTNGGKTLYFILFNLPGMNSLQVLTRFAYIWNFLLLIVGALMLLKLKNYKMVWKIVMFIFPIIIVTDNLFDASKVLKTEKKECIIRIDTLKLKIQNEYNHRKHIAFAYVPGNSVPAYQAHLDAMRTSQELNIPTINGYSTSCPSKGDACAFYSKCDKETLLILLNINKIQSKSVCIIEN
ncbi:MAG: hypothetical protein M0R21_06045 [Lentimicrobiaceae bacterium]|nr:hypothetical protein [Lentimicrobiaceae bacterium]